MRSSAALTAIACASMCTCHAGQVGTNLPSTCCAVAAAAAAAPARLVVELSQAVAALVRCLNARRVQHVTAAQDMADLQRPLDVGVGVSLRLAEDIAELGLV